MKSSKEYIIKSEPLHKNQWERDDGNALDTYYEKRIKTIVWQH